MHVDKEWCPVTDTARQDIHKAPQGPGEGSLSTWDRASGGQVLLSELSDFVPSWSGEYRMVHGVCAVSAVLCAVCYVFQKGQAQG